MAGTGEVPIKLTIAASLGKASACGVLRGSVRIGRMWRQPAHCRRIFVPAVSARLNDWRDEQVGDAPGEVVVAGIEPVEVGEHTLKLSGDPIAAAAGVKC